MAKQLHQTYDVVVAGGGLAGFSAAIAAARQGARTCLVQDRPVFGGNSSSEIRVSPHGAACFHAYARETGIISELLIEERAHNHELITENGWTNSVWDMTMYDMAMQTEGLTFHLNTSVLGVTMGDEGKLRSIRCYTHNAEVELILTAEQFIDCTGDGVLADLAGCEWRMGSEGRDEYNEPHAPEQANADVMGNSIHFKAKDMGRPVPFTLPDWAIHYEDASFFYEQGRPPYDIRSGYWWLEIGIPWHTIDDAEQIRHELTRHTLGVWDWIKNRDPNTRELAANYALDWIGQVPGKRESRRIMGKYLMTEHDPMGRTVFEDEIAFGGWFLDLHTPGGLLAPTSEPTSAEHYDQTTDYAVKSYCGPYGIPLRVCMSKDVDNLMMAGRNVSVTHAALGTVRVMGTTALMGQAVGVAAATKVREGLSGEELLAQKMEFIQQTLLRDGCFLPNVSNQDEQDLARTARITASSEALSHGVGPHSSGTAELLVDWKETKPKAPEAPQHPYDRDRLVRRVGQWVAVGDQQVERLEVCLSNLSGEPQQVQVVIHAVEGIWDYRTDPGQPLAEVVLAVPIGDEVWMPLKLDLQPGRDYPAHSYLRIDLLAQEQVAWIKAGTVIPGHTAAYEIGNGKMRSIKENRSFRIFPPQNCYTPAQVQSGVARPHGSTNLWRSDPQQPLEQWLELQWQEAQRIRSVELTFPGHLYHEYHHYPPFYRDPQCAKSYSIQAWQDDAWVEAAVQRDNYQRRNVLRLGGEGGVVTDRLRVLIHETNGDPSAAIYEIRCYS
ncbi:FAD-dependent oxidoreductase [Paenibacillus daejeonensis]|uniref:FAD-dependent oxidoreductase n=1 Tax=Paenibacillus daejeonensis TaxID=135193 RepID=UPI00035D23EE|nr:FAD-dependent oxidoreductase [Paenibacillus daejeonensis]